MPQRLIFIHLIQVFIKNRIPNNRIEVYTPKIDFANTLSQAYVYIGKGQNENKKGEYE